MNPFDGFNGNQDIAVSAEKQAHTDNDHGAGNDDSCQELSAPSRRLTAAQKRLVADHLHIATRTARRSLGRNVTADRLADLTQDLVIDGLMPAARKWDGRAAFGAFACSCCQYAALSIRATAGRRADGWKKWASTPDPTPDVPHVSHEAEKAELMGCIGGIGMGFRARNMLRQWLAGETMSRIGAGFGVSESRTCQIIKEALAIVKARAIERGAV